MTCISQPVTFALGRNYDVILEGILAAERYGRMLHELINQCSRHFIYYFDVSLEETIKRHATKSNAHEFGEKELRQWYLLHVLLKVPGEKIISESNSFAQTVEQITVDVLNEALAF